MGSNKAFPRRINKMNKIGAGKEKKKEKDISNWWQGDLEEERSAKTKNFKIYLISKHQSQGACAFKAFCISSHMNKFR